MADQEPTRGSMKSVPKGQSFGFAFNRDGQSLSGYVCTINVQQYPGDTPAISRVIAANGLVFSGFLTSTETAALSPTGTWSIIAEITNATYDKKEYQYIRFSLAEAV